MGLTYLYKDFSSDRVEISGGEAQKIALARVLYRGAPFILLDEPTAALDPVSEYEDCSDFSAISGDATTVYISHRLASCRFCDKIAVFEHVGIVQTGTHESLYNESGKYRELWDAQSQYYVLESKYPIAAESESKIYHNGRRNFETLISGFRLLKAPLCLIQDGAFGL